MRALRRSRSWALTGTPVENRLGDLWSLYDFLNPGLLGAAVLWVISSGFFSSHEETLNSGFVSRVEPLLDRGYTVFLVMHGSAPQFELREVNQDIHHAVRFVRCHAGDYGIDPQRIAAGGGSAGPDPGAPVVASSNPMKSSAAPLR